MLCASRRYRVLASHQAAAYLPSSEALPRLFEISAHNIHAGNDSNLSVDVEPPANPSCGFHYGNSGLPGFAQSCRSVVARESPSLSNLTTPRRKQLVTLFTICPPFDAYHSSGRQYPDNPSAGCPERTHVFIVIILYQRFNLPAHQHGVASRHSSAAQQIPTQTPSQTCRLLHCSAVSSARPLAMQIQCTASSGARYQVNASPPMTNSNYLYGDDDQVIIPGTDAKVAKLQRR